MDFLYIFLLFITYSFLGWIIESVYCSYLEKKFVNRGFLIGPYCPIYGCAAVLILIFLSKYESNLFIFFSISVLLSGTIEYITSYILEKTFKLSLWDYSEQKFNINGRVGLENLINFGILSVILIKFIHPVISDIYAHIPYYILWSTIIASLIIFSLDLFFTVIAIYEIKNIANKIFSLDELADIREDMVKNLPKNIKYMTKSVRDEIFDKNNEILDNIQDVGKVKFNYIHKRFMNAFPNIKSIDNNKYIEYLKNLFHK